MVDGRWHQLLDSFCLFPPLGLFPPVVFECRIFVELARHSFAYISATFLKHSPPLVANPVAGAVPSYPNPASLVAEQLFEIVKWAMKAVLVCVQDRSEMAAGSRCHEADRGMEVAPACPNPNLC